MNIRLFQKGFNFSQDGPGNRLVYHLQGCDLHCPWCANPEGIGDTSATCQEMSLNELEAEVLRSRLMFFEGGGITFTGGEPTLQFEALREILGRLKARDVNTAIETNGLSPRLSELFSLVDHLIMDVKHHDPEMHRSITGRGNGQGIANFRLACEQGVALLVRIPLVNGFNASEADIAAFARLFAASDTWSVRFEFLAYHEYGRDKYGKLGIPYTVWDGKISDAQYEMAVDGFRAQGLEVVRT